MTSVDPFQAGQVRDLRIGQVVRLTPPAVLHQELPLEEDGTREVLHGRTQVAEILDGIDDRLLVVVGPCSVHDVEAALDYAQRLAGVSEELSDDLCLAMRVYFEKPRTTVGWKGLINDPHLDGSGDVNEGLRIARELLLAVIALGLPVGCEWLDPITPQYISDLVSWGAIGARTTESQIHRQLGSGLSMPVGFKNRTDGDVQVALDAVRAAAATHVFPGIDTSGTPAILHTRGNRYGHVILRGGKNAPNHTPEGVAGALAKLEKAALPQRVMIDASHDNSGKDFTRQPAVAAEIGAQVAAGNQAISGLMLESFIEGGRQDIDPARPADLVYGQSITDTCMDWETTVEVLRGLAGSVRSRRAAR